MMHPSSLLLLKVSPLAQFHKVNFILVHSKQQTTKKEKKRARTKENCTKFSTSEREREREREDEDEEEEKR